AIAEGTGIRDHTDLVARLEGAAEDVIAAARESPAQRRARARLLDPAEQLPGPRSEQPARLVVQLPGFRLELAAAEQNRPAREQRPIAREVRALRQAGYRAVVAVADHRHVAARIHDRSEADEHRGQALLVGRGESLVGAAAREQCEQQEIQHELLVAHRLLETDAVARALQQRLALENLLRHPTPVPHPGPARPCQARDVESRRLADEMIVGRGVAREVSVYETCVLVDGIEPQPLEVRPAAAGEERRGRAARELPGDRPVDEPDGRLERAAPVRAPPLWTGADPALEVLLENAQIPGFPGQRVALGERHQVQVAIQLPQVLDVPDEAAVAIVEELARGERGFDPGLGIAIPARRHAPV